MIRAAIVGSALLLFVTWAFVDRGPCLVGDPRVRGALFFGADYARLSCVLHESMSRRAVTLYQQARARQ